MTVPSPAPVPAVDRLLDDIARQLGRPVPARIAAAVRAVPRHLFVPDRIWLRDGDGGYEPCDRPERPEAWMAAAYSDAPLVTQFTDGLPSSSASMPSMVVRMLMLADLDTTPGSSEEDHGGSRGRHLELGAGTGFNAALLCALMGGEAVTTVELDPVLAAQAERNLKAAGYAPTVACGDAAAGWAPRSPYERIVATFSVDRIPPAWLHQTAAGGRIVTPWTSSWCRYGTLALTVDHDGAAQGRFHPFAAFMPMRTPTATAPGQVIAEAVHAGAPDETSTSLSPWVVAGGDLDAEFHIGLAVPGAWFAWDTSGEHAPARLDIGDDTTASWATVDYDGQRSDRFTVTQTGPRKLWDEIHAAFTQWERLGRPSVGRYGLTVWPDGSSAPWVDSPATLVPAV
ncbi:protein-L-isoaspartate O-methyltransferase [Streptomyces sp. NPDC058579]|uniref:protein-L-isoaspartate O-methyltransferase family protein n=1 Tax=Streptomyces sp. NPDC058579 TaxID=3346548 RepID=UPI0036576A60